MDINLTAPVNSLGYGVVGLNVALALHRRHTPALWFVGPPEAPPEHHAALIEMRNRASFFNPKAPSLRIYHQFDLAQHVGKGPHCAMPIFELTRFKPVEEHHLLSQDIVFANSRWAGQVLADNGVPEDRIQYAPLGVDQGIFCPRRDTVVPGQPVGPTVFLNCGKWEYRKGHDVLLEAFNRAFEPTDNVFLVMNCHNPCLSAAMRDENANWRYNDGWTQSYKSSKMGARIEVLARRLPTQQDVADMMATADCGVFPSRAEGWGLESAEMLAMGKHVILTDYSAHTEYANATNALLLTVDRLEDAHDGHWFDAGDRAWDGPPGQWAELGTAQVDQLVEHMRRVHRLKQAGELLPNYAGADSMRAFTWDNTAEEITSVLE